MTIGSNDEERALFKFVMNQQTGQNIEKAKDYLLSVCREEPVVEERRYSAEAYQLAVSMRDDVEKETGALLRFHPEQKMVLVSGRETCVEEAARLLDRRVGHSSAVARQGLKQCRLLESEDSSYDSDYEVNDAEFRHDDVSRTVSDTLAAEYAEYVDDRKVTDLQTVVSDPNYTSRVEFGLKLGYTEGQVQTALQKVGARPSQNELLAELIKLGAAAGTDDGGSEVGDDASDALELPTFDFNVDDGSNLRHVVIDGSNVAIR